MDMEDMADSALHRRGARRRLPGRDRLRRKAVVLIAVADGHVVAWHLARTECASAWAALMLRVPAPKMAVCDGSPGFAKAAAAVWPETRIQRCTFHVAAQVRRCTTLRPRLEAGIELWASPTSSPM